MLKTRFDNGETWIDAKGQEWKITEMSTLHLVNLYTMFLMKPERIMSMLLHDVETMDYEDRVWNLHNKRDAAALRRSVENITSLSADELRTFALEMPLGEAVLTELRGRGVNVENVRGVCCHA